MGVGCVKRRRRRRLSRDTSLTHALYGFSRFCLKERQLWIKLPTTTSPGSIHRAPSSHSCSQPDWYSIKASTFSVTNRKRYLLIMKVEVRTFTIRFIWRSFRDTLRRGSRSSGRWILVGCSVEGPSARTILAPNSTEADSNSDIQIGSAIFWCGLNILANWTFLGYKLSWNVIDYSERSFFLSRPGVA